MKSQLCHREHLANRAGLAPLELVLALPIMLFVMALMVNIGTVSTWKVRAQTNARYAAWRSLDMRYGSGDRNPQGWRSAGNSQLSRGGDGALSNVDSVWGNVPVVENLLPAGSPPRPIQMRNGVYRGDASREAQVPMLRRLLDNYGEYRLAPEHHLIDDRWEFQNMGFGNNNWVRAREWYDLEPETHVPGELTTAQQSLAELGEYGYGSGAALYVLDADPAFKDLSREHARILGRNWDEQRDGGHDFHPDPDPNFSRGVRTVVPEARKNQGESREETMEFIVYGPLDPLTGTRRNGFIDARVKFAPVTSAQHYINLFNGIIGYYRSQIAQMQQAMPQPSNATQQIAAFQSEIEYWEERREPYDLFRARALELILQMP